MGPAAGLAPTLRGVLAALAGGVGAARFLDGLVHVVDPGSVTAVVNTADDDTFHGLHVSPDLDSVTYMLAGASDRERGWGLAGETFRALDALARYRVPTWFRLGDQDLATHLYRTQRLRDGATLSEVTAEITAAWGLVTRLVPMSDDPVRTRLSVDGERGPVELAMQEWFVRERAEPPVRAVRFEGAATARPAPRVLGALDAAEVIVVCPSNPIISINPVLAVPGIRDALTARRDRVVAISPLIGGRTVRGPADRLMADLGIEVSAAGVASLYADCCSTLVIDAVDAADAPAVERLGVRAVVTDTLMRTSAVAARLAERALAAVA
jgi:LPPG:FO 2-phospho-L-lactate transferase